MRYFALLAIFLILAPQAHAARIWQGGAELNSVTNGVEVSTNDTATTISTTQVRSGSYAWRYNTSANAGGFTKQLTSSDQVTVGYARAYLYIATRPNIQVRMMQFNNGANATMAQVYMYTDGTLSLRNSSNTSVGTTTQALATGKWYRLELMDDATTNPGRIALRIDGVTVLASANNVQGGWQRLRVGPNLPNNTGDMYMDDVAVNDSTGTDQNSWPGDGKLILLSPNAAGDSNQWSDTSNNAGTTNNYTLVDEIPPNDVTDFVQTGTLNNTDWYGIASMPVVNKINVVSVHGRLRNNTADATTAVKWQLQKASGGTVSTGSAIIPNSTTWFTDGTSATIWSNKLTLYNDPDGLPWTWQQLRSAQIGPKLTAANVNRIQVSAMWVYVDYQTLTSGAWIQKSGLFQLLKGLFVIL